MNLWREVTLGEACELYQPQTISTAQLVEDGPYEVFGANGVIGRYDKFNHEKPQLLVTCRGATCGTVNKSSPKAWINGNAMVVRPKSDNIDLGYLEHLLRGGIDLSSAITGAAQPQITRQSLAPIKTRFPPLPEQRRIAAILDQADALRAKRREALAELDQLTQSIFNEMFTRGLDGPVVDVAQERYGIPQDWSWELLTDVARLATGHTPDREREEYWNGEVPWISLTDIRGLDGSIATKTLQCVTQQGLDNSSAVRLPKGTVCLSRTASVGFVTIMGRDMSTSQDFVNWVCGARITPTYLMLALLSARHRLRALSSGSTHRTIYMRVVEKFKVLVPPIRLQQEFTENINDLTSHKLTNTKSLSEMDSLFASLQHRAFRGEL